MKWLDLREILPEELFDEIATKPNEALELAGYAPYQTMCPEMMGNIELSLFVNKNGEFFMRQSFNEPIGDYGSHWVDHWHKCNNNGAVKDIMEGATK